MCEHVSYRVHLTPRMQLDLRMRGSPRQLPITHMILAWDNINTTGAQIHWLLALWSGRNIYTHCNNNVKLAAKNTPISPFGINVLYMGR